MRGYFACAAMAALLLASGGARATEEFQLLQLDGFYVKWGGSMLGTGATVKYAFVTAPTNFPGARNCEDLIPIADIIPTSKVEAATIRREAKAAFALWEAAANISFISTDDPSKADILIGAQATPRGWAYADVMFDRAGDAETKRIERSLICLNPTKPWKVGFGGDAKAYDLRYAFAHEIGHAIGLNHPSPKGQLMSFEYQEQFRDLQQGDQGGVVALYGKRGTPVASHGPQKPAETSPAMALQ